MRYITHHKHLGILSLFVIFLLTAVCGGVGCLAQTGDDRRDHLSLQGSRPQFKFIQNGFSSPSIKSLLQDSDGFIWVGTAKGLSRYDGRNIANFDIDGLSDNKSVGTRIMAMADDTISHCIWVSLETKQRLVRVDKGSFDVTTLDYSIPASESSPSSELARVAISIMSLDDSTLLCRTSRGFYAINKHTGGAKLIKSYPGGINSVRTPFFRIGGAIYNVGGSTLFRITPRPVGLCSIEPVSLKGLNNLKDAVVKDDSTLVVVTMDRVRQFGVHVYHLNSKKVDTLAYCEASPHGVAVADDGVWVPTNHGLAFVCFKHAKLSVFNTVNTNIHDNDLSCILKVRGQHVFLLGSAEGLVYLSYFDGKFIHTDMRRFSVSENPQAWSVAKDSRHRCWVGCINGLYVQRENSLYFDSVPLASSLSTVNGSFIVLSINETIERDAMIVSSNKDVFRVSSDGRHVRHLLRDDDMVSCSQPLVGNLVVVTCRRRIAVISAIDGHVIHSIKPPHGRLYNFSRTNDGKTLWVLVGKSEIYGVDLPSLDVRYSMNLEDDGVRGGVRDFRPNVRDGVSELWIATSDGLFCKNVDYPECRQFNEGSCLKSDVRSVEVDCNGTLWGSTDLGLVSICGDRITEYSADDHQYADRNINRSSNRGPDGEILLGGKRGVTEFYPTRFTSNSFFPPPKISSYTYINSLSGSFDLIAGHEIVYGSGDITIPASIRGINLNVRSLNYAKLNETDVEWRFESDKVWKKCSADGSLMLTDLNDGAFTLLFRSTDGDGNPQKGLTKLRIVNEVYFFQKRIFIVIVIIALIAIISAFILWRNILHQKIKSKLEQEMSVMSDMLIVANKQLRDNQEVIKKKNNELAQINNELETKVEQRTCELEAAKVKAEESSELKSNFLASLGHEVRTPMNAIVGFAKLINKEDCPADERREFARLILASSNSLLSIMGALLDTSRIERGKIEANLSEVHIYQWIVDTYNILSVEKRCRNVDYVIDISDDLKDSVLVTDKDRLRQIIINLTYNAFKFTERGYVNMTVWRGTEEDVRRLGCLTQHRPAPDGVLLVSIEDTGIGIPPGKTDVIFEPFQRLNTSKSMYGGMGLGLNIVKGFVTILGGNVWVKSTLGVGSTFYFYLPFGFDFGYSKTATTSRE